MSAIATASVKHARDKYTQSNVGRHTYIHITCVYTLSQRMPTFNLTYSVKYVNRCTCHVSIVAEYHRNTKMRLENIALLTAFLQ